MLYAYQCGKCATSFDVVKPAAQFEREEHCPSCNATATRQFLPQRIYLSGTKVQEAEYNPGLGCVVRNKQHRQELCKIKGVEEIGNDFPPESMHKHYDKVREERHERSWAEEDKGWVGEG